MDGTRYKEESLNLKWGNDYFDLAYNAFPDYINVCIKTDSTPYIDKKIKNWCPIHRVDLSYQSLNISDVKSNITLGVEL